MVIVDGLIILKISLGLASTETPQHRITIDPTKFTMRNNGLVFNDYSGASE